MEASTCCPDQARPPHHRCCVFLLLTLILLVSYPSTAQDHPRREKRKTSRYVEKKYKQRNMKYLHVCNDLEKKKRYRPGRSFRLGKRKAPDSYPQAEQASITPQKQKTPVKQTTPQGKPNLNPVKLPAAKVDMKHNIKTERISMDMLEKLHKREDQVLTDNRIPAPTSQKHEQIRKQVADQLKDKEGNFPIELAPLYFTFDEDEFSVVDMDPFLVAVEYALQGRTILIEGHTDARGNDKYNVDLSIKRVQKIRQLMMDMGVPDDRISVVGYGEEMANKKIKKEDAHQMHRRVDFKVF